MRGFFAAPPAQQVQARLQEAVALHQQGDLPQARALYEQVLKLQPKNFDALHLLGVIALQSGDAETAVDLITRAIKVDRNRAQAYNHRGAAYAQLAQHEFALLNYGKAVELDPGFAEAWNNRANVQLSLGRLPEALADLDQALAIEPDYAEALSNRGNVLSELGRHAEALASYRQAVEHMPTSMEARWSLGMACLRQGQFVQGWAYSEARLPVWSAPGKGDFAQPRWTGQEPLAGKTLLVQCEQGLGDAIQFSRYLPLLVAQGAKVVFEVQRPLVRLLGSVTAFTGVTLVAEGDPLPAFDLHVPLLSLPMAFRTDLGNVPAPTPIRAEPERLEAWRAILGEKQGSQRARVGLVWSGNAAHVDDRKRSMGLQALLPLLSPDIEWISLHKDVRAEDAQVLAAHPEIRHFGDQQQSFADAAALCELLDLVISVDTSLAHLAGSMGKPVWILLAHNPDWRWLLDRPDTPWYPSATLFRQPAYGDWGTVLAQVKQALASRFA